MLLAAIFAVGFRWRFARQCGAGSDEIDVVEMLDQLDNIAANAALPAMP
jgi:hypothetical protein